MTNIIPALPVTLVNGTLADATQVQADFLAIVNAVNSGAASAGANTDITSLTGLTTPLSIFYGGTGASTAPNARANLGAAGSGANSDITALTGLTTPLPVNEGGTGENAAGKTTANNIGAAELGANSSITSLTGLTTPLSVSQGGTGGNDPTSAAAGIHVPNLLADGTIKASVYYNGSSIVSSYNVSSVSFGGGVYTINFATGITPTSAVACIGENPIGNSNPANLQAAGIVSGSLNGNSVQVITGTPGGGPANYPFHLQVA